MLPSSDDPRSPLSEQILFFDTFAQGQSICVDAYGKIASRILACVIPKKTAGSLDSMARLSNLDLARQCDNFPYWSDSPVDFEKRRRDYYHLKVEGCGATLGYVPSGVADLLLPSKLWKVEHAGGPGWSGKYLILQAPQTVEDRNRLLAEYLKDLRERKVFKVLSGWRSELYPIYGPNKQLLFSLERSASPLFGVVTYGVHMTAFVRTEQGLKIWAPRRAETKQTYPGMLDNTVAGGLSTGEKPFECLVREAQEEASLPEETVRKAKACGTLTYFHVRDERAGGETGLCQPECQYIYDLELPEDVVPRPGDNEAVDFKLLTVAEVQESMAKGEFKPNCALLLLEFFVRHGILTSDNEPDYIDIVARMHRKLEFPMA